MKIKLDERNYRIHNDKNKALINKSLDYCGAGRSIIIDNDNVVVGGNGIFQAWGDRPIQIIESDGSSLVVVKRTDLHTEDDKRKRLAIMDNSSSDSSEFDMELLQCDFEGFELEDMGVDVNQLVENIKENETIDLGIKQSIQVIPKNEYIIITEPEDSEEWEELKSIFKCETVRSGGCKIGSSSDKVGMGTERVFNLKTFKERVGL